MKTQRKTATRRKASATAKRKSPAKAAPAPARAPARSVAPAPSPRPKASSPAAIVHALDHARARLGVASLDDVAALAVSVLGQLNRMPNSGDRVIAVVLDGTKKDYLLADSRNRQMRGWHGTEADLLKHVSAETGQSEQVIVRSGVLFGAKRALSAANRASSLQDTTGTERRGVLGVNDPAFKAALAKLRERGAAITPTILATEARVNGGYRQAKRYMERMGIPETPASTPSASAAAAD